MQISRQRMAFAPARDAKEGALDVIQNARNSRFGIRSI